MCIFLARFVMHGIAYVSFLPWHGFSRCDSTFSLALPFPNSFDEMGSLMRFVGDGEIGFEAKWGGSLK